ncbi:MAG: alanine racemase [Candidatus Rifleibacteriota bacterium]
MTITCEHEALCTPYARIDVQKLKENIETFAARFSQRNIALRPHIKTHKCPQIAKMQIENGAVGLTVATLREAEAMINKGFSDIFIAYPIVGEANLRKFSELRSKARLSSAVDSIYHLDELLRFSSSERPSNIRIEIDCGQHRCGIQPEDAETLLQLANFLKTNSDYFYLEGVFTHAGQVYRCTEKEQIAKVALSEQQAVIKAALFLRNHGFDCNVVSVGSTPTSVYSTASGITEARPGNYVFYDAIQVRNTTARAENCSYSVVTRVIGSYSDRLIIDAGSKALGLDKGAHGINLVGGYGIVKRYENLEISALSEEHGTLTWRRKPERLPATGDLLEIIPNHSCASANLFSCYQVFQQNKYIGTWEIVGKR